MTTAVAASRALPATRRVELRKPLPTWKVWLVRAFAVALFAIFWEAGANLADSLLIPTFSSTMVALWETTFVTGEIWGPLAISNLSFLLGYPIAVIVAVPLGLAMARWKRFDKAFSPIVAVSLALPIAPLIPVVLIAMGLGITPRIFIIFLFAWVFIATNVRAGVRAVDKPLIEMASSFGASERVIWWKILIPGATPAIMTGLRTGLGRAFAGMVIVELIMLPVGIGALMLDYRGFFQADLLYATTIAVVIEAVVLAMLMQRLERRLLKWK
ncbi:NitT/TauT family transport system permease protein [Agrococcus baldri]|uniref:NitT/TauT family transport system permease protein n=1 Tax=Agrococcus baldri TaxID=153730 RepID=A0AA94HNF0_9MICO|nr:ABC transporter permease [Agrococcus baldri]SFS11187.1 NitT/TauT family transport system permease protein [Agrococcus baldri]